MNVIEKLRSSVVGFWNRRKATQKNAREIGDLEDLVRWLGLDPKSIKPGELSEATYFACIKILSEAIGKMPLKILRHTSKNGVETMRSHPLYHVLHDRPNPYMTASTFWSTMERNRNHYGNAYAWIKGAGRSMTLWILPPNEVEVWVDDRLILADQPDVYYKWNSAGKSYVFGSDEILHLKSSDTIDGLIGIPVKQQLALTIDGGTKSQELINAMYDSGFTAKAVLQYTGNLSDANVKTFAAGIENYAKGKLSSEGIKNIIPIPVGAQLTPLNVKLTDNQFIEVKQFTSSQIAAAFGIKPYQYNDYTKSSYASAEAQQLAFYVDTLLYIVKQYEEEITYKLLSGDEIAQGYHSKFNVSVILRADLSTQIQTLSNGVANFIYTPNEARAMLDLEAKPGGDRLLGNGASIPVELTGSQYSEQSSGSAPSQEEGGNNGEQEDP